MSGSLLLLIVCYALLALLLLALCLYTRWSYWVKTATIVAVTGFYFLSYEALTGLMGYPTPGNLPTRFVLHHAVIASPDKASGEKGAIHLWATELGRKGPAPQPRAYTIPWEKDTEKTVGEAMKKTRDGIVQIGSVEERLGESSSLIGRMLAPSKPTMRLQDQPAPSLPEK